jgi:formiminotetrahydrofolate cyclodeaminase
MLDQSATIQQFLDGTAAKTPTPGGGAVTALAGALAAAVGEMSLSYSIGKKGLEAFEGELRPAQNDLRKIRESLANAMADDQAAYAELTAARQLPDDAPEKAQRIAIALHASIAAPQQMAATAVRILEICDRILNFINPHLLSDLAICADLAMATARCAIYSVKINLRDMKDAAERHQAETTVSTVLSKAAGLIQRVAPRIWERVQQGGV